MGAQLSSASGADGAGRASVEFHSRLHRRTGGQKVTTRELIAIRPITTGWPLAARLGLDWALSHALDDPAPAVSLQWSSTGVAPHFDVKATTRVKGGEVGLGGTYASASCRRFELTQTGSKSVFPGIACQNAAGDWVLPDSGINIARPAARAPAHGPALRSAAN